MNQPDGPTNGRIDVVAGAILDDEGRLLAARRTEPPELAGGWELPGGKVEPGEDDESALTRELLEELGVDVEIGVALAGPLAGGWPMGERYLLRVYRVRIVRGSPEPLEDHDELRWLDPGQWWDVPWLAVDMPVVRLLEETDHRVERGAAGSR